MTGYNYGIFAQNGGSGGLTIIVASAVTGTSMMGIFAEDDGAGDLSVTTGAGPVTGQTVGIYAPNIGGGDLAVTTGAGAVTGTSLDGIRAVDEGTGDLTVSTGAGMVTGGIDGIYARDNSGGKLTVTMGTGLVDGSDDGIDATSDGTGGLTITTGAGTVFGNRDGISASNTQGALAISTNGDVTGVTGTDPTITTGAGALHSRSTAIYAFNSGTGQMSVTTGSGDVTSDIGDAVRVRNSGNSTALTVTTGTGALTGGGTNGLYAWNNGTGPMSITGGTGAITGGADGISADNTNPASGDLTIVVNGDVTGTASRGIFARNFGANLSVTTGAGDVLGEFRGIAAYNNGTGEMTISTGAGSVTGTTNYGIFAFGVASTTNLSVTTGGLVYGGVTGIHAGHLGSGALAITTGTGGATGVTGNGITATNTTNGTDLTVTTGDGDIYGGSRGISIHAYGSGAVSVTTDAGDVSGQAYHGIYARTLGTDLTILTGSGAVTGGRYGISTNSAGSGTQMITGGTGAITGSVIGIAALHTNPAGGDLIIAVSGDVTGETTIGAGIYARNDGANLSVSTGEGDVYGGTHGIFARNFGSGALTVTTDAGEVTGYTGVGILAENSVNGTDLTISTDGQVYGGFIGISGNNFGSGALAITTGAGGVSTGATEAINAYNSSAGTDLTVITADGEIEGNLRGILARNEGSGALSVTTGSGDVLGASGQGILAINFGTTMTIVTGDGNVIGATHGIMAQNDGSGATTITTGPGTLAGGSSGIAATSTNSAIAITIGGTVQNNDAEDSSLAITASGAAVTLDNDGLIFGRVMLGATGDTFTNTGDWVTTGISDFAGGTDELNNVGFLGNASAAGVAETTELAGLESFSNGGVVNLIDETAGNGSTSFDTLTVDGNFHGHTGSVLQLDVFIGGAGSQADMLLAQSTSGQTLIRLNNTNGGQITANAQGIVLVDVDDTGLATAADFALENGPINAGLFTLDLMFDDVLNQFLLISTAETQAYELPNMTAGGQNIWYTTASFWQQHQSLHDEQDAGWQIWGDMLVDRSRDNTSQSFGLEVVDTSYTQNTLAGLLGVDYALGTATGQFEFGAMAGFVSSDMRFASSGTTAGFEGFTYGLRAAYRTDQFRLEALVKQDDLSLNHSGAAEDTNLRTFGAEIEGGVDVFSNGKVRVEAVASLAMTRTEVGDLTIQGSRVSFDGGDSKRAAIGVNVFTNWSMGATMISPVFTAKLWNEFDGENTALIGDTDPVALTADTSGMFGEFGVGVEFAGRKGAKGMASGSVLTDGDFVAVKLGLNYSF